MAHIVGVWELGGHLGHLGRFAALVPRFIEQGHKVTLVLRDLSRVQHLDGLNHASVVQAPLWMPKSRSAPIHPVSMPEILQHFGYLSAPGLHGMVRAWSDTFDALKPDLLLCDYAPTALFAARGKSFVCAAIGSGYSLPPDGVTPMPAFRSISPGVRARALNAEKKVTQVIQRVAKELGQPRIDNVCDIFKVDEAFLCTLRELDHYERPEPACYWGLPTQASSGRLPAWSDSGQPRVFAYVKPPGAHFDATIKALQQSGHEAEIFAPGITPEALQKHASNTLRISSRPYDLVKTFKTCDAVICHAGHETVVAALLAGRPVVLIPLQMEQYALARRVEAQGLGEVVASDALSSLPRALERTLSASRIEQARAFACKHAVTTPADATLKIVERCEQLLMR
ncbi:MAG: glycosyltransferase [Marinobacter sp.]|uniref:glycosyltransferase n=1 Tax=Marinobacter sp. TaxID=50741 RepID=UPI0034A04719